MSIVNACVRSIAPPSSSASDDAATGEPDSTRHAPSQPSPNVLQGLSVNTDPSRLGISAATPAFIVPSAVTNSPSPTTR